MEFSIGKRKVGGSNPAFIIAEVSANHRGSFKKAVDIIKAAAFAGADAVKLQTYTAEIHTLDSKKKWFYVGGPDNPKAWKGQTFFDLYKKAYTPWEWHKDLKKIAEDMGLIFFSTPVDSTSVDFLETLKVPCYKIASYEATDLEFLEKVASTKKPVILSVGFASLPEIELSLNTLKKAGAKNIATLYCTASYGKTADHERTNLRTMLDIRDRFNVVCGFSDNMGGIEVPALAASMGASIIEKHIIDKHDSRALDDRFSLDKFEFKKMVQKIRSQEKIMGKVSYGCQTEAEKYNRQFRRSLFATADIKKGDKFTRQNMRSIRPGYGLAPKHLPDILNKKAAKNVERGTPLSWSLIK